MARPNFRSPDSDLTLGGRVAAAFVMLMFSVPLMGVLWLLFNSRLAFFSDHVIPASYLGAAIVGMSLIAFVFPRLAPTLFGWLCELAISIGRWW